MRTLVRVTVLLTLIATTGLLPAGEKPAKFDPAARAKVIAPFIDEQAFAVARVNVSRIEADPLLALAAELVPAAQDAAGFQRAKTSLAGLLSAFSKAGGKDVYFVAGLADLSFGVREPQPVFAIVPLSARADVKALSEILGQKGEVTERLDSVLFAGSRTTLQRLEKKLTPDDRPALTAAFAAAGDTAAQVLFVPPRHWQRVIEEMMPTMPPAVGGGPSTIYTRGIRWAALGADPPLQFSLKLVIQSQDPQAAKALRQKWDELARLIGQDEDVRQAVPNFAALQEIFTPKVEGDRLVLALGQKQGIAGLISALKPAVENARRAASRFQSANNLRQIALAMAMYASEHKQRLPAPAIRDAKGKPLLSWRVALLPYIEHEWFYKQFHLDEPWDSDHNSKLIGQMPAVFHSPGSKLSDHGRTNYLLPLGNDTLFPPGKEGASLNEVASPRIAVVEVNDKHAVVWTKPEDLPFDPDNPLNGLGGLYEGGFNASWSDGHVEFVPSAGDAKTIRERFVLPSEKGASQK